MTGLKCQICSVRFSILSRELDGTKPTLPPRPFESRTVVNLLCIHALIPLVFRNNSSVRIDVFTEAIVPSNARMILEGYDLILDCTDNAPARYLLNDIAVELGKPLISGAALKYDGQLVTYNLSPNGPCYRCLFPTPPSPQLMGSCEENGVLGVVTGIIGSLQALETIKLITGQHGMHFWAILRKY